MSPESDKPLLVRFLLPLCLVGANALLLVLAVCIERGLRLGWDPDHPMILVLYTLLVLDYPVFTLLELVRGDIFELGGEDLFIDVLALLSSVYWFVIGCLLQWAIRRLRKRPQ